MANFDFYALRCVTDEDRVDGYAVINPGNGEVVSNRAIKNGYMHTVLQLSKRDADALAVTLAARTGHRWEVEGAPRPCPKCHRAIAADDLDFCYPANRQKSSWRAGCNEHDFGCGYEVTGDTYDEVMEKWNYRDVSARAFIRHQRLPEAPEPASEYALW